jgi:hypothetical protein
MSVLVATLVANPAEIPLSDARIAGIAQAVASFYRRCVAAENGGRRRRKRPSAAADVGPRRRLPRHAESRSE